MKSTVWSAIAFLLPLGLPLSFLSSAPIGEGHLLISAGNVVYECTLESTLVQSIPVPYGIDPRPLATDACGVVVDEQGRLIVFNGKFSAFLSVLDAAGVAWTHVTFPKWGATEGRVACNASHIFASDFTEDVIPRAGGGIVRFDSGSLSAERFFQEWDFRDVAIGYDGLLYGIESWRTILKIDPATMEILKTLQLDTNLFGVAANEGGEIFVTTESGIRRLDADGNLLNTGFPEQQHLYDIALSEDGYLAVASRDGVFLTNESLTASRFLPKYWSGSGLPYVAFVGGPSHGPIVAQLELPAAALAGAPATVGVRLMREGLEVLEPVRFSLLVDGSATFADQAIAGSLIEGRGTSRVLLESLGGRAAIEVEASGTGLFSFAIESEGGIEVSLQEEILEDFEDDDGGLVHSGDADLWKWLEPSAGPGMAHSGAKAWATYYPGQFGISCRSFLLTPRYVLPEKSAFPVFFEFWNWVSNPSGPGAATVLLSVDGGPFNYISSMPGFRGAFGGYHLDRVDLQPFLGRTVQFRFAMEDLSLTSQDGWYLDDLAIRGPRSQLQVLASDLDADGDGISNEDELEKGTNPLLPDSDGDGLHDLLERQAGADPLLADTDGGGTDDFLEFLDGKDAAVAEDDYSLLDQVSEVTDAEHYRWRVGRDGRLAGPQPPFESAHQLFVNGRPFRERIVPPYLSSDEASRSVLIGPLGMDGLKVSRSAQASSKGDGFLRRLEILQNLQGVDQEVSVTVVSKLGPYWESRLIDSSSGDASFTAEDDWVVLSGTQAVSEVNITFLAAQSGANVRLESASYDSGQNLLSWGYRVRVPAFETVALLHFTAVSTTPEKARAKAQDLDMKSGGLTEHQIALVENFPISAPFHRGDANGDGAVDISDGPFVLNYLFLTGAPPLCEDAADANDDGALDISDGVRILTFLFQGGLPLPSPGAPPFPCGPDTEEPERTGLSCESYTGCASR